MKKRTVALVLTMAVSISTLIGCASNSKEFAEESSLITETSADSQTTSSSEAETEKGPLPDDYFAGTELDIAVYRINGDNTESFNDKEIIKMVTERNFVASCRFCRIVKCTSAHSCTQTAGVTFFSDVKNNLSKLCPFYNVFNIILFAKLFNIRIIGILTAETGVKSYCNKLEFFGIEYAQICH